MLNTNDVFNDAVRGSRLHAADSSVKSGISSKVVGMLLLSSVAFVGFNFYSPINSIDTTLVVKNELIEENQLILKNELVAEIQIKFESLVVEQMSDSEEAYLSALRDIETELTEEREAINLDTQEQSDLSLAMSSIIDDIELVDSSIYANALRKEIGVETVESASVIAEVSAVKDSHTVIVKKGDTLQSISDEFYGDAMNYKRIIASNASLNYKDTTIYEGQTILLPY